MIKRPIPKKEPEDAHFVVAGLVGSFFCVYTYAQIHA